MAFTRMINAVDAHVEGQHGRVIFGGSGVLDAPGATMLDKMRYFEREADWLRRFLLNEPRGNPTACATIVLPPTHPEADAGYVIMENQPDYVSMSGSNTFITAAVLLETGMLPMKEPVTEVVLEAPGGLVPVRADCRDGRVRRTAFASLPSFVTALDVPLEVEGVGRFPVDVAWGGMSYVSIDADALGLDISPGGTRQVRDIGLRVLEAARKALPFHHPEMPDYDRIDGVVLHAPPRTDGNHSRTTVVVETGQVDRSPCGTGVCARLALLHARGELDLGTEIIVEGQLGTTFGARLLEQVRIGEVDAVVPELSARVWITGFAQYVLRPDDPFPEGFRVADIWPPDTVG